MQMNSWEPIDGKWVAKKSYLNRDSPDVYRKFELNQSEEFINRLQIWQAYPGSPNIPKGSYTFNDEYNVNGSPAEVTIELTVE
jgi:hypothetical protein